MVMMMTMVVVVIVSSGWDGGRTGQQIDGRIDQRAGDNGDKPGIPGPYKHLSRAKLQKVALPL
jgi:hypothetical protein